MNLRQPKFSPSYKDGVAKISYSPFTAIFEKSHPPFMKEGEGGGRGEGGYYAKMVVLHENKKGKH